jgi:hypothetical protein
MMRSDAQNYCFNLGLFHFTYYDHQLMPSRFNLPSPLSPEMHQTQRLLEAAAALSSLLKISGVPHAFHGSVLTAVVSNNAFSDASVSPLLAIIFTNHIAGNFLHS